MNSTDVSVTLSKNYLVAIFTALSRQRKYNMCLSLIFPFDSNPATVQAVSAYSVKPVFKTTREIGTTWELRAATSVPRPIQYTEMDPRKKTTSEFR